MENETVAGELKQNNAASDLNMNEEHYISIDENGSPHTFTEKEATSEEELEIIEDAKRRNAIRELMSKSGSVWNSQSKEWQNTARNFGRAIINGNYKEAADMSASMKNDRPFNEYVSLWRQALYMRDGKSSRLEQFDNYLTTHSKEFISRFGDWEKANRLEKLKQAKSLQISNKIIILGKDETAYINELRDNPSKENLRKLTNIVSDFGKEMLQNLRLEQNLDSYASPVLAVNDDGKKYHINFSGIKETSHHNLYQKGHIEGIYNIPQIIESAIYLTSEKNEDNRKPELKQFHYYSLGLKLDDDDYTAKIVFTENRNGEIYYDQSLSTIEKGKLIDLIQEKNKPIAVNPINRRDSNELSENKSPSIYYDKRLISVCQVPQMPYLEMKNGKWQPTEEAIQAVKEGKLYIEKNGQNYTMHDENVAENKENEQSQNHGNESELSQWYETVDWEDPIEVAEAWQNGTQEQIAYIQKRQNENHEQSANTIDNEIENLQANGEMSMDAKNAGTQENEPDWKRKIDNMMEMAKAEEKENKQSQENSSEITASNSSLEQTSLDNAAELLKNISFNSENYKELVDVINKISKMSGKVKIQAPSQEEIKNDEKIIEINPEISEQTQNQEKQAAPNEIPGEEPENQIENQNPNEQNQSGNILSNENEKIIYGKTILPDFSVIADGKLQTVKNAVVAGYDKETKNYLLDAVGGKMELPSETFKTLFNDKIEQEKEQTKVAEGRAIVFEDKERGVKGTVLPEFSMITQNGIKTYKGCVVQSFNSADKTYTLSNGDTTLSVSEERFKEISSEERFEKKFDENAPSYQKLLQAQYNDYFKQRDNTSYNFRHNLSVYCRKEANSPLDALRLAKDIVSRMPKDEQRKTKSLLEKMRHEGENINELIVRTYHEAIKEVPLNEDYIKKFQPGNVIARPFYDTISDSGKPVENDSALVKGEQNRNLKIGDTIRNVDFSSENLFGIGKNNVHFAELKVVSASKEGNSITLMDKNKSYFKLPRDTFLDFYKAQQLKEMRQEQKNARRNSISLGYA